MIEIIERLCKEHGTNITALCKLITGSSGNLPTWRKGNIRNDYLLKIADYFNVSTDYLLGKTDNPKSADGDITFDDFTYAFYEETKELTEKDKEALLDMARIFKKRLEEEKSK